MSESIKPDLSPPRHASHYQATLPVMQLNMDPMVPLADTPVRSSSQHLNYPLPSPARSQGQLSANVINGPSPSRVSSALSDVPNLLRTPISVAPSQYRARSIEWSFFHDEGKFGSSKFRKAKCIKCSKVIRSKREKMHNHIIRFPFITSASLSPHHKWLELQSSKK